MDPKDPLNEFVHMDNQLKGNLNAIEELIEQLLEIEQVRAMIIRKEPQKIIEQVENEEEVISNVLTSFKDCRMVPMRLIDFALQDLLTVKSLKVEQLELEKKLLHVDIAIAYIRNCASYHFKDLPVEYFLEIKTNFRFKISKLHILANKIASENPKGLDSFRRTYADIFKDCENHGSKTFALISKSLDTLYELVEYRKSWDSVIVKLMIVAHLVCTFIKKNGVDISLGFTPNNIAFILGEHLYNYCDLNLMRSKESWSNVELLRDLDNTVTSLDIPDKHSNFDRTNWETRSLIRHLNAQSMERALQEFIPANSEEFMGVCAPPVASLATLCYNNLPLYLKDQARQDYQPIKPSLHFEVAA